MRKCNEPKLVEVAPYSRRRLGRWESVVGHTRGYPSR